jgi:serine/threonine protein kinase
MAPLPHVPGYELIRPLGGGPISEVYLGRDCRRDTFGAVKVLRREWADDPTAVQLLRREARVGATVRHPHLVRLLDARVAQPPYFLVMELLAGETLRERLRREYRLDRRAALWVVRQTAEALAALHRAGCVHGDVKPDNVRLVDAGTAVLVDLGFAHRPGENAELLQQGYVLGTADYLAPELCAAVPDADQRADVFSLGVMLFELLTGERPYPPGSLAETMAAHAGGEPADLRDYPGPWPPRLADLLARMLSRRPGARPRTAAVVQELIDLEIATLQRRRSA